MSKKRVRDDIEGKAVDPPNVLELLPFLLRVIVTRFNAHRFPTKLPNVD
jgi:hypothetical protein